MAIIRFDIGEEKNEISTYLGNIKIPEIIKPLVESPDIPEESFLFYNFVFKLFDREDFFDIDYINEVFTQKLVSSNSFSGIPSILQNQNKIIIEYREFKIIILKEEIGKNIDRNSLIIEIKNKTKSLKPGDKSTLIQLFLILREFDGFIFEYQSDTLKVDKNKDLRNKLKIDSETTKKLIKQDLKTINGYVGNDGDINLSKNNINISGIEAIKRNLSLQFSNASRFYSGITEQLELFSKTSGNIGSSLEMTNFKQIVEADIRNGLQIMSENIERLENDMISLSYIKDHQDIVEKMKLTLEGGEIVSYREKESKIVYKVKTITDKVLGFFKSN